MILSQSPVHFIGAGSEIWERLLFLAKLHFALTQTGIGMSRSAMKLPQQARSQVKEFGNEGPASIRINHHLMQLNQRHPIALLVHLSLETFVHAPIHAL